MKNELPRFLVQATQFIDPLFHSFYYMQLNIFYLILEKMNGFAENRFEVSIPAAQIESDYETHRSDALERQPRVAPRRRRRSRRRRHHHTRLPRQDLLRRLLY